MSVLGRVCGRIARVFGGHGDISAAGGRVPDQETRLRLLELPPLGLLAAMTVTA